MESWQKVWRTGLAPLLATEGLEALEKALLTDDARLLQGATTDPPPLQCVQDWPVDGACLIGICGVEECGGFGTAVVGDVEEFFAKKCFEMDQILGEPAACRWLLNWYDDTPREEMRKLLLPEVRLELATRRQAQAEESQETRLAI